MYLSNDQRKRGHMETLYILALGGMLITVGVALWGDSRYDSKLKEARIIAERTIGDRKAPLTDAERVDWFRVMGVDVKQRPSYSQLQRFVQNHRQ